MQPCRSGCSPIGDEQSGPAEAELCHASKSQAGRFLLESYFLLIPGGPRMNSFRALLAATLLLASANVASAACTATVNRTVKICSPTSGATVTSPVTFSAGALDTIHTVTAMIMYIDSVKKAQSANSQLSAILSLPAGKHAIVIRAWDSSGFFFSSSESITVAASPTPTPTPTPSPTPTPTPTPTATPTPTPTATPTPTPTATPTPTPGPGIGVGVA